MAWQTAFRLGFPLATLFSGGFGAVAFHVGQALLLVRSILSASEKDLVIIAKAILVIRVGYKIRIAMANIIIGLINEAHSSTEKIAEPCIGFVFD
jgi:hypothetical protein